MAGEGVTAVQDARTFVARLDTGTAVEPTFDVAQGAYFYVIEGELGLNDSRLRKRDASYITAEGLLQIRVTAPSELLAARAVPHPWGPDRRRRAR
jgi:hypothetical protein